MQYRNPNLPFRNIDPLENTVLEVCSKINDQTGETMVMISINNEKNYIKLDQIQKMIENLESIKKNIIKKQY